MRSSLHGKTYRCSSEIIMRIEREYFYAAPCQDTIGMHCLDFATHSIIREYMEKSWHRVTMINETEEEITGVIKTIWIIISGYYLLLRFLLEIGWLRENSSVIRWLSVGKQPIILLIAACLFVGLILDVAWSYFFPRYRLLQSVRKHQYKCGFAPVKETDPDVILHVVETNCTEEFVKFRVYPDRQYTRQYTRRCGFHPYAVIVAQITKRSNT